MKRKNIPSNHLDNSVFIEYSDTRRIRDFSRIHYHRELEFLKIHSGSLFFFANGREYLAAANEVVFINSEVPYSILSKSDATLARLRFYEEDFSDGEGAELIKYAIKYKSQQSHPIEIFKSAEMSDIIDGIFCECSEMKKSYGLFVKSAIYKILGILYREEILSDSESVCNMREVQRVIPIISYIDTSYKENLTLELVSEKFDFDESYFCRIFKTATGATFTEYLNFVRICKAEELLSDTSDSIYSISEAVGFSSVSYFNRVFKRYRNCSPRAYRTEICQNVKDF